MKHKASKEGIGEVGEDVKKGRGRYQGGGKIFNRSERKVEGIQTNVLRQITGNWERRKADGMWVTPRAELLWGAVGNQS